jgi:arsenate reductase
MSVVTLYHNPKCSTSRNALALIRHAGIEPEIIEYLKTPPSRATLETLLEQAGLSVRDAVRSKEAVFEQLGLDDPNVSDDAIFDAIQQHPVLLNRPFVCSQKGARLGRPLERILDVLPPMPRRAFSRENGTPMLDDHGKLIV